MKANFVISIIVLIFAQFSNAGKESGGGNAVVCKNPQGQLISAEVFDLWEGRSLHGYFPSISPDDYKMQARAMAQKLKTATVYENFFLTETERIINEVRFLSPDAELVPIRDGDSIIKPKNCDVFQTAVYQPNGRVYFDSNIWNLLNETNRAALITHEVLYAFLRSADRAEKSDRARQYVSYLYSGQILRSKWTDNLSEHFEICRSYCENPGSEECLKQRGTVFYTRLNPDGTWKISFDYFNGFKVLGLLEINAPMEGGNTLGGEYAWPIASHNLGGKPGGDGVGFFHKTPLDFDVDEGWSIEDSFLDYDSNYNYLYAKMNGEAYRVPFTCEKRP